MIRRIGWAGYGTVYVGVNMDKDKRDERYALKCQYSISALQMQDEKDRFIWNEFKLENANREVIFT